MRIGVIGCGVIGKLHAKTVQALAPRAELAVVVDSFAEKANELAREVGVEAATSFEEVLRRDDIDAVTVCTPSGQHADVAVAALEAGKHVIIEKPIDITLDAARRIIDAEQRSDATAMVVSQRRHDKAAQIVREAVTTGMFGRVTSGSAQMSWWRSQAYYDSGEWRGTWALDGGGALMNQGIHTIDLLVWFLGEPVEVFAWADCLAHERIEVEDIAVATVRFASGALGTIHGTTAAYPGLSAQVGVYGDRGSAVIDNAKLSYFHAAQDDAEEYAYGAGGSANQAEVVMASADDEEGEKTADGQTIAGLQATSHTKQFEDFLDAVEKGRQPLVTVHEATRTLSVIRGIYESARTGRVVRLEELTS
ncbi:MAG TPA: Gfo/Idh/MocA family oxidoreductase [Actinopolymorphaceae bacterium]